MQLLRKNKTNKLVKVNFEISEVNSITLLMLRDERERERKLAFLEDVVVALNGEREAPILASREHSRLILAERAVMSLLIMNLHSHD